MTKAINLLGQRFGRLVVVAQGPSVPRGGIHWHCQCDCGTVKTVGGGNLRRGKSKSCGCLSVELTKARQIGGLGQTLTHGAAKRGTRSPEYVAWLSMRQRCNDKNTAAYIHYGGRGISVCERWAQSFSNFLEDMGKKPSSKHSIDRIDVDGNYEPGNCRWATMLEQQRNRRNARRVSIGDSQLPVAEAASLLGVSVSTAARLSVPRREL